MTGFDPLAALAAEAAAGQTVAAIELGVQLELLQQQLSIGDLLTATILSPQGGADRLQLLGQTVQAQLPPGIDPGQTLLLQITGFNGNQILVRNLGVVDPNDLPATSQPITAQSAGPVLSVPTKAPVDPSAAQATLVTVVPPKSPPATSSPSLQIAGTPPPGRVAPAAATENAPAPVAPSPVAPSRAVFVAASVQPANLRAPASPGSVGGSVPEEVLPELGLEARIAATRAAAIDIGELVTAPLESPGGKTAAAPGAAPVNSTSPVQAEPRPAAATPLPPSPLTPVPPRAAGIAPELALLARLRIPALPFTLAAARLAGGAASLLPRTFARLDAALAGAPADGRAASLRTLLAFMGRLDPADARALPEQLMAYVSNVVDASEGKLAAMLRALAPSSEPSAEPTAGQSAQPAPQSAPQTTAQAGLPGLSAARAAASPASGAGVTATVDPAAAARVAERATALQYDAKAAIVSLLDTPAPGATPEVAAALNETLTAMTALQLNVLNAQAADAATIAIPLPVFYHDGGRPVQLRISRDAPQANGKLDADNFHIAFILDTRTLGTVAVDVKTVSRSVIVSVKTERPSAASRFQQSLTDLRARLEQLHYRVASIAAAVAPQRRAADDETSAAPAGPAAPKGLDLRA